jgi:hypothetical protein
LPDALALVTMAAEAAPDGCHASGKPVNAPALLLAGVQQVSGQVAQMRAAGTVRVNEIILQVLETLYRGLGFRFATVCLKDPKSGQYRSRLALGELQTERQAGFVFPLASDNTLFHLAMANNADLIIADAAAPTIRDLLPAWHRALLPDTRSLMVLPLVLQSAQIGFFYADRAVPAPEGVPPEEAALVRALKDQVLAALAA